MDALDRYEQERKEARARRLNFAQGVATALGPDWKVDEPTDDQSYDLWSLRIRCKGRELWLDQSADVRKGKVLIGVGYPSDLREHVRERPSIGVGAGKAFDQIAKDIERRLMPAYLAEITAASKRADRAGEHRRGILALEARVRSCCSDFDEPRAQHNQEPQRVIDWHEHDEEGGLLSYGHFTVTGPDDVSIELRSCPGELAIEIANTLQRYAANERNARQQKNGAPQA